MENFVDNCYTTHSELELLGLAKAGDQAAFHDICQHYYQRLYETALVMLHNPQAAETAVKHTLEKAFDQLHEFKHESLFFTWICRQLMRHILQKHAGGSKLQNP